MKLMLGALGTTALLGFQADAALTAYWDFEGDFVDSVSTTEGTAFGDASADGAALAPTGSNSLSLDGTGDWVSTNTNGGLSGTGSFTVLAFIQTEANSDSTVFSYSPGSGGTGGADLRLIIQANGDFRIEMSAGAGFNLNTPGTLNDGQTHLVAAVFNSTTGDSFQDVDLYVDGTLYDVTGGTDHTVDLGTTPNILLGKDHLNARPFNGLIDDVAIYDEALSLTQLNDIAANGVPEPGSLALLGLGGLLIARRRRD